MKAASFTELRDKLGFRRRGYQQAFAAGAPGHAAMTDLARFCRAFGGVEAIPGDHDRTLILAGRRQAFWRIMEHLHLQPDQLIELYRSTVTGESE